MSTTTVPGVRRSTRTCSCRSPARSLSPSRCLAPRFASAKWRSCGPARVDSIAGRFDSPEPGGNLALLVCRRASRQRFAAASPPGDAEGEVDGCPSARVEAAGGSGKRKRLADRSTSPLGDEATSPWVRLQWSDFECADLLAILARRLVARPSVGQLTATGEASKRAEGRLDQRDPPGAASLIRRRVSRDRPPNCDFAGHSSAAVWRQGGHFIRAAPHLTGSTCLWGASRRGFRIAPQTVVCVAGLAIAFTAVPALGRLELWRPNAIPRGAALLE